jgi:hypothetical protein
MYVDTQEFHIQVRSTHGVKAWSMLDSLENPYMPEESSIVNQQFFVEEEDVQ